MGWTYSRTEVRMTAAPLTETELLAKAIRLALGSLGCIGREALDTFNYVMNVRGIEDDDDENDEGRDT